MASSSDSEQIEHLQRTVAFLTQRLYEVERHLGTWQGAPPQAPNPSTATSPGPNPTPPMAPHPHSGPVSPHHPPVATQPWWQMGPLKDVSPERLPAVALAAAGGLALMFGLLFFVWYAVDQGWLSPVLRVILGMVVGVVLMGVAWRLAPRNRSVAGALGGAGLGGWFAAWLVARHVHELVGHTETFVALALGSAACLVIAGPRHLRLMAFIAGLAAYITPVATSTGSDRLHELMVYQVVIMGALWGLEQLRKWPELVLLALVGTWTLMLAWATEHLASRGGAHLLPWCAAILALGSFQALQAARRGEVLTGSLRYGVGALFAWIAVTWAASSNDTLLWVSTGLMALWHAAMLGVMHRQHLPRAVAVIALTFAWLQAFEFGPLAFDEEWFGLYWMVMATVAVGLFVRRPGWGPVRLWLAPGLGALLWTVGSGGPASREFLVGLLVAAGLLVMGAWPKADEPEVEAEAGLHPHGQRALTWVTASAGFVAWFAIVAQHFDRWDLHQYVGLVAIAPALAWAAWASARPAPARLQVALGAIGGIALVLTVDAIDRGWFRPMAPQRVIALATMGLAALAALGPLRALRNKQPPVTATHTWALHDTAGVVSSFALGSAAMLAWVSVLDLFALAPMAARSLLQAGWSVVLAAVALALVVAGLRLDRVLWRRLGLAGLFSVAAKVVFVDLGQVDLAWRVVSFLGLGVCLIAGAWAYGRFEKRIKGEAP